MAIKTLESGNYSQPSGVYDGRLLTGEEETVAYLPGKKYRIWHNDQNVSFNTHRHNALEIILCTGNIYTVIIEDQTYKLREGDVLFVPPNSIHQIVSTEAGERFIMLFDLDFLKYFGMGEDILSFYGKAHLLSMSLHPHLYPFVYSSLSVIIQQYFTNEKMSELYIYTELLKIFGMMYNSEDMNADFDSSNHTDNYDKFINILSYIDTNYAEELALESVASTAGFSKFHFSRLFKQYTGTTFYDYLCSRRVMVAKNMLSKNMPVTDVAFQTGFNNLTTFCRCFKKYTGLSPSQYKNSINRDSDKIIPANHILQ